MIVNIFKVISVELNIIEQKSFEIIFILRDCIFSHYGNDNLGEKIVASFIVIKFMLQEPKFCFIYC